MKLEAYALSDMNLLKESSFEHSLQTLLQYNSKEGSVRLVYEAQPRPRAISSLATKTVIKVACGNNHSGLFWPSLYPDSPSPCLSLLTGSMQTLNTSPNRCT
jgi:hypothetical protein